MRLIDPDEGCVCGSGLRWSECCAGYLPLTLRYLPVRLLGPEDSVRTGCRLGGHCCQNVHVPLTPFDVLRLARRLGIETGDVLTELAHVNAEGIVEMEGDPRCPLLDGVTCTVYEDRPDSCRMYPFWRIPDGETDWLVERHTCSGCWRECRSEPRTAAEVLARMGVDLGREMDQLYQDALVQLEHQGVAEDRIEEFMARVYDSDSVTIPGGPVQVAGKDRESSSGQKDRAGQEDRTRPEELALRFRQVLDYLMGEV